MSESSTQHAHWSTVEVEATVEDYFEMLLKELRGESFSKAEHNRGLRKLLGGRSRGAVERKHQNISAILIELGLPYIVGYKPLRNYQDLLRDSVADRVDRSPELVALVEAEVERPADVPTVDEILRALVDRPERRGYRDTGRVRERELTRRRRPNYLLMEAANSALGAAGEQFVLNFERARLIAGDRPGLADRIEHVSLTRGDFEGFDVLSFEPTGQERLIEVKTTRYGAYTPFYVTQTELDRSREDSDRYHVHRVFGFREQPKLFTLPGPINESCQLDPAQYVARVG